MIQPAISNLYSLVVIVPDKIFSYPESLLALDWKLSACCYMPLEFWPHCSKSTISTIRCGRHRQKPIELRKLKKPFLLKLCCLDNCIRIDCVLHLLWLLELKFLWMGCLTKSS